MEDARGVERPFSKTYELYFGNSRGRPHYVHAMAASAILLSVGTLLYWANPDANSPDWELSNIAAKFRPSNIRFDDNKFTTNNWLHPLAGSGYYALTRVEHVSIPIAMVYAVSASTFWEFILEWKEKSSINDLIMTPLGGVPIGECILRLNDYLNIGTPRDGMAQRAARYSVGMGGLLHRTLHGEPMREDPLPNDELGFSTAYTHRFFIAYQAAYVHNDQGHTTLMQSVLADTEIIAMPGFLRAGRFSVFFTEGNFTDTRTRVGFAGDGLAELDMWFHAALLGYYAQDIAHAPRRGHALSLAMTTSLEHYQRWLLDHRDEVAVLHLPGPSFETWIVERGLTLRAGAEASLDFGSVRPAAFGAWHDANPWEYAKSVLEQYGYAYDWGVSTRLRLTLQYRGFELTQRFAIGHYQSIEGLDRYEERITRATPSADDLIAYDAAIEHRFPETPFGVRLGFEARLHRGSLGGFDAHRFEDIGTLSAGFAF